MDLCREFGLSLVLTQTKRGCMNERGRVRVISDLGEQVYCSVYFKIARCISKLVFPYFFLDHIFYFMPFSKVTQWQSASLLLVKTGRNGTEFLRDGERRKL